LPEAELMSLPIGSLHHDFCFRGASDIVTAAIYEDIEKNLYQTDNTNVLSVNKINGKYYVFNGNNRLKAMNQHRQKKDDNDTRLDFVRCNVYEGLDYNQKHLINNPKSSSHSQNPSTIMQKVLLFFLLCLSC
jgi:hypothetical protein